MEQATAKKYCEYNLNFSYEGQERLFCKIPNIAVI